MIQLSAKDPKGIIWISSYPRSGNTWTRAFIHCLVKVMADPEFNDVDINRIEEFMASESAAKQYRRFLGKPSYRATQAEIAAARPKVQERIVARAGRPVFVKTHNANAVDHGTPLIHKGVSAGALYLVRNPLDVAISFAHLRGASIDQVIDDMASPDFGVVADRNNVHVATGSWSQHVRSWSEPPHPAVLVVRYEDLIEEPHETFKAIANHMLIKPTDEQLVRAMALSRFDRLRAKEEASGFVEKPESSRLPFFREGRAGQWRDRLTPDQVARVISTHGPTMRRFGYLPEGFS